MCLLPLNGNFLLHITLTTTKNQNISYKDDILPLNWVRHILCILQFHIEAHNENFIMKEVKLELNFFYYSCCIWISKVRKNPTRYSPCWTPSGTATKPCLIHTPLSLKPEKIPSICAQNRKKEVTIGFIASKNLYAASF